jgi:arylmalonate decarboxylase
MSEAVVHGLRAVGAQRVAVSTAYSKPVNDALSGFLKENGIETLALESFGITEFGGDSGAAGSKTDADIIDLSAKAIGQAKGAEGVLISCGGLQTLRVAQPIEDRFGLPVVTSTQSAFWKALQLVDESGKLSGFGRMLGEAKAPEPARV